jgi:hypothetical protein
MLKAFQSCYEKVGYVYISMVSAMIVLCVLYLLKNSIFWKLLAGMF